MSGWVTVGLSILAAVGSGLGVVFVAGRFFGTLVQRVDGHERRLNDGDEWRVRTDGRVGALEQKVAHVDGMLGRPGGA